MVWNIVCDSSCDLRATDVKSESVQFETVPLRLQVGAREFLDNDQLEVPDLLQAMAAEKSASSTACPSPAAFARAFEKGDRTICFTISANLSGTYQSACIAASEYQNIYVVDSRNAAIGSGILAQLALEKARQGMEACELAAYLERKREDICLVGLLDTLEYLKRGGRISRATAFAGGVLNIKPVVTVQDGEVVLLGKARGSRQGNNLLMEKIHQSGGIDFSLPILLGYSGLSDAYLRKYVADSQSIWQGHVAALDCALLSGVIGTHTGPGVVAVAFFKNEEH